ncbi:probable E3 ubiquitin-protein ligase HERC4 [Trichomycterus rosablanca]|uniref:probable E3 ubiquitin-protein ligase HERC4 n=1 Tax=Trichomycterus rosablanca TaxID=2290929 RepID=UPI002F35CE63
MKKKKAALFSSGQEHVVLVSKAGTVFEWKRSESNIPRSFSNLTNKQIAQVACGNNHSIVLTKDGQLFTWGENSNGQLGLGTDKPSSRCPEPLKSLYGIPLAQISAGGDHSFALSLSGTVFGWGKNSTGQLGLGDLDDRHVPACVKSLKQKKTLFISCGEDHTAVLTKGGVMFTFGSGCYGQLGHNSLRNELLPRVVAEFWGTKVSHIACGRYHTLALVGSSKTLYAFGCAEQQQLGNEHKTNQCVPVSVHLPPEYNSDQAVQIISAGGNLSVICFSKRDAGMHSAESNQCLFEETAVLDMEIIDRWIPASNSKSWRNVKRKIKKTFSSASIINGSFIEKSGDKHYKTGRGHSGLDLSLARLSFMKLAKRENILSEIVETVEKNLLPSLGSTAVSAEALRIYLILPELLQVLSKQQRCLQLTIDFASAILNLDDESQDILTSLWTRLPDSYFETLVKTFHSVCEHFMSKMTTSLFSYWTEVTPLLKVLQNLYTINSQRVSQLADSHFHIKKITKFLDIVSIKLTAIIGLKSSPLREVPGIRILMNFLKRVEVLVDFSCILETCSKQQIFLFLKLKNEPVYSWLDLACGENTLRVNRQAVFASTVEYLETSEYNYTLPLKVKFFLEDGIDDGGIRAEFFSLLGHEITKRSDVIQVLEDSGLFWFSAEASEISIELYIIGIMCGLAFYNLQFMNIGFPLALFKKLLNHSPTLSDLEELSPVEARCLKDLLLEDEDVEEVFCLDFTVKGNELVPNGAEISVTNVNRQKYVDLYVDYVFNKSVKHQFEEFAEGFSRGCPFDFWKMYQPEELKELLYGKAEYKWKEFQKGATYENCTRFDKLIQNFWTVFFELDEEHQKKFLKFIYGTDRLPVGGLSKKHLKIVRYFSDDADNRFPSAQTCYGVLLLPDYSNIQILRKKLIDAITFCDVFGNA